MNQKGLSLIEVVVSLAIMSIVLAMLFQFVQIGLNTSTNATTVANVQKEAQTSVNQLKDWIMETNRGIVCYGKSSEYDQAVAIYNGGEEEENYVQILFYRKSEKWLYYDKINISSSGFRGTESEIVKLAKDISTRNAWKDYLFSQFVKSFQLDITQMMQQKVTLVIQYENKGKFYQVNSLIKLRNVPVENPAKYEG